MKYSSFAGVICLVLSSYYSHANSEMGQDLTYTGIPDRFIELSEVHLVDINKVTYSVYTDEDFGLRKVIIAKNDDILEISGKCFQQINFPDLQTLKIKQGATIRNTYRRDTTLKMEFHYLGDKANIISENYELSDWHLQIIITNDVLAKLEISGEEKELSMACETKNYKKEK